MFVPGITLSVAFYRDAVRPIVAGIRHSAARIGPGSEVLGFDTPRSADHDWGPCVQLFLTPTDAERSAGEISRMLSERLPRTFMGFPTHFERAGGEQTIMACTDGPARHRVEIADVATWMRRRLGVDPTSGMTTFDWLATPTQALAEVTGGAVFHDGLGQLEPARAVLQWYPPDVWRHVLVCQWQRVAQEEAFVGRCGEVGDDLGSAVVAARLVRDLMRLGLLLHRRYPPYGKWLGSAFARVPGALTLTPVLTAVLAATVWTDRERHLATAYETVADLQNRTLLPDGSRLCVYTDPTTRPFHDRPFRVLMAGRFADALHDAITDPTIAALSRIGAADQHLDSTDLLTDPARTRAVIAALDTPG